MPGSKVSGSIAPGRGIVRLLTRADFDGSVCAAMLQELGLVDEILYVHPKDLQDNKIEISESDTVSLIEPPLWMWVILP